ncbi:MAG TPA: protein-disulfide reductase DsbD N-terminal domain-containing protein [Candidatus Acidoferrum sp.]
MKTTATPKKKMAIEMAAVKMQDGKMKTATVKMKTRTRMNATMNMIRCGLACFLLATVAAVAFPQMPSGREVVDATSYASSEPVARGSSFQLAVVLKIRNGFHINAREKSADYLIATDLKSETPAGFKAGEVAYPKGQLHTFSFSKTPLNVYEDKVVLRVPVNVLASAPLGEQRIPLKLRFQACSNEVCLPPVTVDVESKITVTNSASASRPAHPELFPPQ